MPTLKLSLLCAVVVADRGWSLDEAVLQRPRQTPQQGQARGSLSRSLDLRVLVSFLEKNFEFEAFRMLISSTSNL